MKNRMLVVLSLLALVRVASADILVVRNQGNGPVPLKSAPLVFGPVEVAKAETNGVARITWTFAARSTAAAELTMRVGFPLLAPGADIDKDGEFLRTVRSFLEVSTEDGKLCGVGYFPPFRDQVSLGPLTWAAGTSRTVTVTMTLGDAESPLRGAAKGKLAAPETVLPFVLPVATYTAAEEPDIAMAAETVEISERDPKVANHGFTARCRFTMTSHAATPLQRTVAFPANQLEAAEHLHRSMKVTVDGAQVTTALEKTRKRTWEEEMYGRPEADPLDYAGYVIWKVRWEPGQTREIVCEYDMGGPEEGFGGLVQKWRLLYVVRTGALWRGPIGKADIVVRFREDPRTRPLLEHHGIGDAPAGTFRVTYSNQATWVSPMELRWHFVDWEPTDDLVVERVRWQGLHDHYSYLLPTPYGGGTKTYTDAWLNELTEREVAPWRKLLPQETKAFDVKPLRRHIAECLYHEIKARHGDPFIIGKTADRPHPQGVVADDNTHLYSRWMMYFVSYSYHGGWYRPDRGLGGPVPDEALNEQERANRQFLDGALRKK